MRWPVLVIAILAAVVGSQAIITGTFSIIKQCSSLGCFPEVKIIHTSSKVHGQIYIPEINWFLMVLCLAVTIGFQDTGRLSNASGMWLFETEKEKESWMKIRVIFSIMFPETGLAVITVMLVTTCLMSLVIVLVWERSIFLAIGFIFFFGSVEALYFCASLVKFLEGAWVPIVLACSFLFVMYIWHYGALKKYQFDVENKVSINWLLSLGSNLEIVRVPGIGLIHTELVSGIPAIFSHFVANLPAFHRVLVFICVKFVPVPHVKPGERFLVGRIGPRDYRIYRCIVRYGYRDVHKDDTEFESDLVCSIAEFIRSGKEDSDSKDGSNTDKMMVVGTQSSSSEHIQLYEDPDTQTNSVSSDMSSTTPLVPVSKVRKKRVRFIIPAKPITDRNAQQELQELMEAREAGVAYIIGNTHMRAKKGSSILKKMAINHGYDFLRRNSRGPSSYPLNVHHASTLEVAMVYDV